MPGAEQELVGLRMAGTGFVGLVMVGAGFVSLAMAGAAACGPCDSRNRTLWALQDKELVGVRKNTRL